MILAVRPTTDTSASSPATSPAPTAGPWIGRHDRLGAVDHVEHQVARLAQHPQPGGVVVDHLLEQLEAAAGREPLAGAAEQRHLDVGVAVDRQPHVGHAIGRCCDSSRPCLAQACSERPLVVTSTKGYTAPIFSAPERRDDHRTDESTTRTGTGA